MEKEKIFLEKGSKMIQIERFADHTYIAWNYKKSDEILNDGMSLGKRSLKRFMEKKKKEGFKEVKI